VRANSVIARVGADGKIMVACGQGNTDVLVDGRLHSGLIRRRPPEALVRRGRIVAAMNEQSRRPQLNARSSCALVATTWVRPPTSLPTSRRVRRRRALLLDGAAWVLLDEQPEKRPGRCVGLGRARNAVELHVLAEHGTGLLARRAAAFTFPVAVWHIEGRTLLPALPEPLPVAPALPAEHQAFAATVSAGGALPVVEHGVLVGEVDGLEVCRVVTDPHTDEVRLEVGVGAHDREAFLMLHGNRPTAEALADVVRSVGAHRRPGAPRHPLNMLAQERSLRARLVAQPHLIAASSVAEAAPPCAGQ
jgi:hypothetical protein